MKQKLLTPDQAAQLKGVSRSAIYAAIDQGRLPHVHVLGRLALKQADVEAWTPRAYAGRPGAKGGFAPGRPMSDDVKRRISEAQKRRLAQRPQKPQSKG